MIFRPGRVNTSGSLAFHSLPIPLLCKKTQALSSTRPCYVCPHRQEPRGRGRAPPSADWLANAARCLSDLTTRNIHLLRCLNILWKPAKKETQTSNFHPLGDLATSWEPWPNTPLVPTTSWRCAPCTKEPKGSTCAEEPNLGTWRVGQKAASEVAVFE